MNFFQPFRVRLPAWADWFALALMALAAPAIAVAIHSGYVLHSGYRLYNAEVGGAYFHGSGEGYGHGPGYGPLGFWLILTYLGGCGVPAIPTFLALLPFRKRALYRWLVWAGCIILWTWLLFQMEIAIH
jgi:hypothetical protein